MPKDDFKVVPVKGMSINGHIDPRSEDVCYLCLMRSNVSQRRFFEWFYTNITCPMLKNIRRRYNPASTPLNDGEEVPDDQKFVMWGDSDIPYLQQMITPERIAAAMLLGLYFAKIGAKITENSKPLDMGQMFKILRLSGRQMTSIHKEKPLSVMIDLIFK